MARSALEQLTAERFLQQGEFTPGREGAEWVEAEVLRRIRRASLAASRQNIAPVPQAVYASFLTDWQQVVPRRPDGRRDRAAWSGADGLLSVIDQLSGVSLPLSAWESQVLPARLPDYTEGMLDAAMASGEVVWSGHGRLGTADAWVRLHLADALPLGLEASRLGEAAAALAEGSLPARILSLLRGSPGALRHGEILTALADARQAVPPQEVHDALWDLAFAGLITNDSFGALRSYALGPAPSGTSRRSGRSRPASRRGAARLSAAMMRQGASSPSELITGPSGAGRWSALRVAEIDHSARSAAIATLLMDRHGVVNRGAMGVEDIPGSFAAVYRVLSALEDTGSARRGYFVDGLGASQFAPVEAVDRLRDRDQERHAGSSRRGAASVALAVTDPANPYGAALPWPALPGTPPEGPAVRPARRAGALVLLVDGHAAAFVDRGGKHLMWWDRSVEENTDETAVTEAPAARDTRLVAEQLVRAVTEDSRLPQLQIERINGHPVFDEAVRRLGEALLEAGCYRSPRSIRLRSGRR